MTSDYEYMRITIDRTVEHMNSLKKRADQKDGMLTDSGIKLLIADMNLIKTEFELIRDEFN